MSALPGLRVVHSSIHGYGGVALRPFSKGETVCVGDGVLYGADDDFDDTYALLLDGADDNDVLYDLVDQTRWFNHSCDPNTEVMGAWDPEKKEMRAWWEALRDIAVGEEITYDYAFAAEVAEACHCGTKNCRGVIVEDSPEVIAALPDHLRTLLR